MDPKSIARVCHEANRALQTAYGEVANPPWDLAPRGIRASAIDGVENALSGASPEESHENWLKFKRADGWVYGEVKDFDEKTHPCMVPYNELPEEQKIKDHLFIAIVNSLENAP